MKTSKRIFLASLFFIFNTLFCLAQEKTKASIGILNIDSKGIIYDAQSIDRIEIGDKKTKAVFFDKMGKATIKWVP